MFFILLGRLRGRSPADAEPKGRRKRRPEPRQRRGRSAREGPAVRPILARAEAAEMKIQGGEESVRAPVSRPSPASSRRQVRKRGSVTQLARKG